MRTILDTSVLVAGGVGEVSGELAISAVSLAEIHFGVLVARNDVDRARRLRLLTELTSRFDPLPVDATVASSFGLLAAAVKHAGRQPRPRSMDLLIAATAHAHDARLATLNAGDLVGTTDLVEVVDLSTTR
ncbi:type II toxin-antitoxin system VapC family toxin [Cellulomonas bogoriensis]|uniref:Ribonuclease VapC n=1 Tax=Cellulomonas bogoriensis 69B4 = DSM 16987 TaxID=1386082 RepID=A0A0A0C227_9CELL|nr:type II toxin-antitoxin system VapC family toxin [Cellulomonas bogoriensis]KGM14052.1 twitching motility protein PilT [Cellulomonas bogoriensis 69B4 = DSM 16987]